VAAIVKERAARGMYRDIYDFIDRLSGVSMNKKGVESLIRAGATDSLPGNRYQKLVVFEKAMDGAAKQRAGTLDGQMSLFGLTEEMPPPPPLPPHEEYPLNQLLSMEKEVTGVYVSGHPLDDYREELSKLEVTSQFLAALRDEATDGGMSYDQQVVSMGGMVAEKRLKATKSGSMMAFVQLEDLYGVTEVLVFPRVYDRVSDMLTVDNPVVMTGKLSVREEETPKLLLDSVRPLRGYAGDEVGFMRARPPVSLVEDGMAPPAPPSRDFRAPRERVRPRRLYLKLLRAQMEAVLKVLSETPGGIRVFLYLSDEDRTLAAPNEYWVDEGYDFGALAILIGADAIVMK
jgi:DNA polymerase-3 subunit alpha